MSGIIGGAGSKSGVIGTTELDYEEGTFTPTGTGLLTAEGTYTKIGNMVSVEGRIATNDTTTESFGGLPYTTSTYTSGTVGWQNMETTTTWSALTGEGDQTFYFKTGSTAKSLTTGKELRFAISYPI